MMKAPLLRQSAMFYGVLPLLLIVGAAFAAEKKEPVDWVDPMIGAVRERWFFFSSACRPFGMVNLSPDTAPIGKNSGYYSGYDYTHDRIHHFSHVHEWCLSALPVMPITGPLKGPEGSETYASHFSHDDEIVRPGYHAVTLEDYGIRAELTSTERVGFHRYTFHQADETHILFDIGAPRLGDSSIIDAKMCRVNDRELQGFVINGPAGVRNKPFVYYFTIQFDRPFTTFGGWAGNKTIRKHIEEIGGKGSGAFVTYATVKNEKLQIKVGLSCVSVEQARKNLAAELPHWDFDRVRRESRDEWNQLLGKIEVEGGTPRQRTKFYTDLWHVNLGRRLASDVDGKYCDWTGPKSVIRQIPLGADGKPLYHHYHNDAFWCTFWNLNTVWGLAYPDRLHQWVNFLVDMYETGGLIPRGPCGGNDTYVMIGAHSTPLIVGAYMKGIRQFDVEKAYEGMRKNAFPGGLMGKGRYEYNSCKRGGIEHYIELGYIPHDKIPHAAAKTLEYAYDDWCLAQMAKALGKEDDYRLFIKRAGNYRNVFDPSTGFMRPRNSGGKWLEPFDPLSDSGWCEANAWQYLWFVPHDVLGLIDLMGGREKFNRKLNYAFEMSARSDFHWDFSNSGLTQETCYVNYANQPGMSMAHLFNYSGAPWLAQKWVRAVLEQTYGGVAPTSGYPDDEDQGQESALAVLMAVGLFQMDGGCSPQPIYEITSPVFDRIVIHLDKRWYPGEKFEIVARNNSPENKYIQSARLNGKVLDKPWFYHRELVAGGLLELELGPEPNRKWGSRPEDVPPSVITP